MKYSVCDAIKIPLSFFFLDDIFIIELDGKLLPPWTNVVTCSANLR